MSDQWWRMSPHQTRPPTPKPKTQPTPPQQFPTPSCTEEGKPALDSFDSYRFPPFLSGAAAGGWKTMEGSDSEHSEHSEAPSDITTASPGGGELVGVKLKLTVVGDKGTIKVS